MSSTQTRIWADLLLESLDLREGWKRSRVQGGRSLQLIDPDHSGSLGTRETCHRDPCEVTEGGGPGYSLHRGFFPTEKCALVAGEA